MFFTSASAHLFHGKSHYAHMSCFLCDLSSICFNTFFFSIMQISICSPIWYFKLLEPYLIPILGIQCSLNVILILIAQTSFKRYDINLNIMSQNIILILNLFINIINTIYYGISDKHDDSI